MQIDLEISSLTINQLSYEIFINDEPVFTSNQDQQPVCVKFSVDNDKIQKHIFKIKVEGKRKLIDCKNDTQAALKISKFEMNQINILPMVKGKYYHNFNGFGQDTVEDFNTVLGCDGILEFTFFTPLSYWVALDYPY